MLVNTEVQIAMTFGPSLITQARGKNSCQLFKKIAATFTLQGTISPRQTEALRVECVLFPLEIMCVQ